MRFKTKKHYNKEKFYTTIETNIFFLLNLITQSERSHSVIEILQLIYLVNKIKFSIKFFLNNEKIQKMQLHFIHFDNYAENQ